MAKEAGVVKSLSGKAVAVDQNGNERELKVGDIVYMGESVKTSDAADKVTIVANNGKELTVLGSDTLSLNPNTIGAEGLADISALQNAILNGGDLTKLEETAAGGNAAAGGGDGVSLGEARFAEGGHYSNINETYRNLTDTNRAFASYDSPIGGYNDGNDGDNGANTNIIPGTPTVKFLYDFDGNHTLSRVEHGNDTNINTSKVLITVPNDGTVRAGDILKVTVTDPNGNETTTNITITPSIITNGYPIDAPVEPGKN
ncbi:retention module-containing protein [Campylobacter concisus]